jgi:hypothetical protein
MEKNMLINSFGNKQVKDVAGILHNYTPNGTMEEHINLEKYLTKYANFKVADAMPYLEELLEF